MAAPKGIPEDIWRSAAALRAAVIWESNEANEIIAGALLAERIIERERCYQIAAEHLFDEHELAQATEYGHAVHETAGLILSAIRGKGA